MKADWKERDFERWFQSHARLPDGESILLITRQRPIRRVVDLVGIDAQGGLVIIEVKNEATNRRAIGQALEYLSHYEDISQAALAEEFEEETGRSLVAEFREHFRRELPELSPARRVYLVGPEHDAYAAVCADYLSRHLAAGGVQVELLVATRRPEGFELSHYRAAGLRRASDLPAGFALSPRHQLFQIVATGPQAVLWHLGRLDPTTRQLRLRKTVSRRVLRSSQRLLMPCEPPGGAAVEIAGTTRVHRRRAGRSARVIGYVRLGEGGGQAFAFVAVFDAGKFKRFERMPLKRFDRDWLPGNVELPDWRGTAQSAGELHLQKLKERSSRSEI